MDFSICDNQENVVESLMLLGSDLLSDRVKHVREVGRAT